MTPYPPRFAFWPPPTLLPWLLTSTLTPQFRMHASERVGVHLTPAVTPVIEKCTGVYFSEYPANPPVSADGSKQVSYAVPLEARACAVLTRTEWM